MQFYCLAQKLESYWYYKYYYNVGQTMHLMNRNYFQYLARFAISHVLPPPEDDGAESLNPVVNSPMHADKSCSKRTSAQMLVFLLMIRF